MANSYTREDKVKRYLHLWEKSQQFLKMLMPLWVLNALKKRGYHVLVNIKIKQSLKTKDNPPFFSRSWPLHTMKTALNYALFYKEQHFTVVSGSEVQTKERKLRFEAFFSLLNLLLHSVLPSHQGWSHTMPPASMQLLETDVHSFPIVLWFILLGPISALFSYLLTG